MFFQVDGKPFFPLGGQANNSSAYNAAEIASAIAGVKALGGNTLEAPVYWGQVEPQEGQFYFQPVDELLTACRAAGLKLVILWFATWKNGEMRYAPEWVKTDRARFRRVRRVDGTDMQVLSSHCRASLEADKAAFSALAAHLKAAGAKDTVIAMQVENEPGILGSDRDYGPEAMAGCKAPVPAELLAFLKARGCGPTWQAWQDCGAPRGGSWLKCFGEHGPEFEQAWSIARYIDEIAGAGKALFPVPHYANVWLGEQGWQLPGLYPAGGAVGRVLDVWKAALTNLDFVAPDIYLTNPGDYRGACEIYHRADNPLFVPESGPSDSNALNMLRAIADYDAEGYCYFAADSVLTPDGSAIRPEASLFAESVSCVKALLPLLVKFHGTGRVHSVVQESGQANQRFLFERFIGLADFANTGLHYDHRHTREPAITEGKPQYGLIVEASPEEFYLVGNFRLYLVPRKSPEWMISFYNPFGFVPPDYLTVEEGTLDEDGVFHALRERNGDEASWASFWATPRCGVVRVRLTK